MNFIDEHHISQKHWDQVPDLFITNFFQTYKAFDFFNTAGLETFVLGYEESDELKILISGIVQKEPGLKAHLTKRAIIYGGPALTKDVSETKVKEVLLELRKKLRNKAIYIEFRNLNDYSVYQEAFESAGFDYIPHLNFHLDCTEESEMKKRMSSSKMRQVKKSIKEGAEIIEADQEEQIIQYYHILEHLYKTKVKTPLPDFAFFKTLLEKQAAKFLLIRYKNEVIGGIVCPILDQKTIYEWFVCGKDGVYKNVYPSILATWAAMQYAVVKGIPRFDFMGAGKPDEAYGVREFKSKFGGEQVSHGRFLHVTQPVLYKIGKTAVELMKAKS